MEPDIAAQVVMVFDVPSTDYIPSLVAAFQDDPFYNRFLGSEHALDHTVHSIFHLCGEGVLEDDRYKTLLSKFAPEVQVNRLFILSSLAVDEYHLQHFVSSRQYNSDPVTFTRAAFHQANLNILDADMFPIPKYRLEPMKKLAGELQATDPRNYDLMIRPDVAGLPSNTSLIIPSMSMRVRPSNPLELPEGNKFHDAIIAPEGLTLPPATLSAFEQAKQNAAAVMANRASRPGDDVVVVPLGTGSAIPAPSRNGKSICMSRTMGTTQGPSVSVSSTLISIPGGGNLLLDCGEGTWGQLVRLFGDDPACSSGVWEELRKLKCVFLSHVHGDHHIGVAKLLAMRKKV